MEAARGVNLASDDARLWTLLGLARYRLVDVDGAAEAFETARLAGADDADLHWGLGLVAIARNRPGEARRHVRTAMSRAPRPRFALALAKWSTIEGDYRAAAEALETYAELAPDDPDLAGYRGLGLFYERVAEAPAAWIDPRVTRAQVNFDLVSGDEILYVPVRFEGHREAYVLLDTGAERNVVDRDFARSIGIGPILPGGELHGVYRPSPAGYAIVDSLTIGSVRIERVPFAVGDFGALSLREQGSYYIAGVINPALLFRDFTVVLDYHHRRIELIRAEAGGGGYGDRSSRLRKTATRFHFDANGVWPVVSARLDGSRPLPFLVDTGASDILLDRDTSAALRVDPRRFRASVADHAVEDLRAILLDRPPGERWGMGLHGILGFPFFRGMRMVFDYKDMTMILEN